MSSSTVTVHIEGLKERQAALRKAGASLEDLEGVNRKAIDPWFKEAVRRAPRRTGRLARSIGVDVSPTTGKVVANASAVVYGPVVHFGWSTRNATKGLTRKEAQARLDGVLTRRTVNKSFRQSRDRSIRRRDESGKLRTVGHTKAVRGGPIKAQPWMYEAADARGDEVVARWTLQVTELVAAVGDGG